MSLPGGLATLAVETLLLIAVVFAAWAWRQRRGPADRLTVVASAVLGVAAAVVLMSTVVDAARTLHHAKQTSIAARRGLTYCFVETQAANRLPFINWLRQRLPERDAYEIAFTPQPDEWCLTLALLPRVPAFGHDNPRWLVVYGTSVPVVEQMIARHDPAVQVFAPGFALVRLRP